MISISGISTKASEGKSHRYRFRNEEDISQALSEVMVTRHSKKPIHTGTRGGETISPDVDDMMASMLTQQELYNKTSGIRVREEIISISRDEISSVNAKKDIIAIADRFSDYFFYQGFQTAYGVYPYDDERGKGYDILYTINAVSYQNGAKYRRNAHDYQSDTEHALKTVVASVTGKEVAETDFFDISTLEYYP